MAVCNYAPDIEKKLEYSAIDTYLVKHGILTIEESYQEYQKPFQIGQASNADLVRKLLPKIEKNPRGFYEALKQSVNDPDRQTHENHVALLKLLPHDMSKKRRSFFTLRKKGKSKKYKIKVSSTSNETSSSDAGKQSRSDPEDEESSENSGQLFGVSKTLPCSSSRRRNSTRSLDSTAFYPHHNMVYHGDTTPTSSIYGSAISLDQKGASISPALHAELKYKTEQIVIETLQKHQSMGTTVPQEAQPIIDTDSSYHSVNNYHGHMQLERSPKPLRIKKSAHTMKNTKSQRLSATHAIYCSDNHSLHNRESKQLRSRSQEEQGSEAAVGLQSLHSERSNYKLLFEQQVSKVRDAEEVTELQSKEIQSLHKQLQAERHNFAGLQEQHSLKVHQLEEEKRACNHLLEQRDIENSKMDHKMKESQHQSQQLLSSKEFEIKNMESTIHQYSEELHKTARTVQHYKSCNSELQKQLTEVKDSSEKKFSEMVLQLQTEKETVAKEQEIRHTKNLKVVMDDFGQQLETMNKDKASLSLKCHGFEKALTESQETSDKVKAENSDLKKQLVLIQREDKKAHQLLEASKKETEGLVWKSAELQEKHVALQSQNKNLEATIKHLHKNLIQCENDKKQTMKAISSLNYQLESKDRIARQRQFELEADLIRQKKDLIQALILQNPNTMNAKCQIRDVTGSYTVGQVYSPSSLFTLAVKSLKTSHLLHEQCNRTFIHINLSKSGTYKFSFKLNTGGTLYILCCVLVYLCLVFVPLLY